MKLILCLILLFFNNFLARIAYGNNSFNKYSDFNLNANPDQQAQYYLESIAKLDDITEEIRHIKKTNQLDKISFTLATLANITPASLAIIGHMVSDSKKSLTTVFTSQVTSTQIKLSDSLSRFFDNLSLSMTAIRMSKNAKSLGLVIHRDDLGTFIDVLSQVRKIQKELLVKSLPSDNNSTNDIVIENRILESRPSYKTAYSACSQNATAYIHKQYLETLKSSIVDLYYLTSFTPFVIKSQLDAQLISPSLKHYVSQEVLENALTRCFSNDPNSIESYKQFIDNLYLIEHFGHGFVPVGIATAYYSGKKMIESPKAKQLVQLFQKVSPPLVKRALIAASIIIGIFYSHELKISFDEISDADKTKYTQVDYRRLILASYLNEIESKLNQINTQLSNTQNPEQLSQLQNQRSQWLHIYDDLKSHTSYNE